MQLWDKTLKRSTVRSRLLSAAAAPIVALTTTVVVSVLGIHGLTTGAQALQSALRSAASAHQLEIIAAGVQEINGSLYHVLTERGAQVDGFHAATELRPLLDESTRVADMLTAWRDTQATPEQQPRVTALIDAVQRYRGAVDFVSQMLDVDFVAAVSFLRPFDKNFSNLMDAVNALVREVQARERAEADHALTMAATTIRAFEAVVAGCMLMAVVAAADMVSAAVRAYRLTRQNSLLTQMSQTDALTGLGNRRSFDETLAAAWAACGARRAPLALVLMDIDHFKKFNDSQGHQAGDTCLSQVAVAVMGCTRGVTDKAARYGGEEFAIVLPNSDLDSAWAVAERVRQSVAALALPHSAAGPPGIVTVSLGVATLVPRAGESAASLIEAADKALYAAKRAGRNQVAEMPESPERASVLAGSS